MRYIVKTTGLGLAALATMSMAFATAAYAKPIWLVCLKEHSGTTTTKWTTGKCVTAGAHGGWEWSEPSTGVPATLRLRSTLTLGDTKTSIGEVAVECVGEGEGLASGSLTKLTHIKTTSCRSVKGCEGTPTAEALHLPWETEFFETESKKLQLLKGTTNGEPGWKVNCEILKSPVSDECVGKKGEPESHEDENRLSGGELLVLETFPGLRAANCSQSGTASGILHGVTALLSLTGTILAS